VKANPGGSINHLSSNGCIHSFIDTSNAVTFDNISNDGRESRNRLARVQLAIELHSYLRKIYRMDYTTRKCSGGSTAYKGLGLFNKHSFVTFYALRLESNVGVIRW